MPRALSWAIIAAAFLGGTFLPDLVTKAAVPPRKEPSSVALDASPDKDEPAPEKGLAPGGAVRQKEDGSVEAEDKDVITPLNVRDASALVMTPGSAGKCAPKPCDCSEDSLHRYQPKKTRRKDLESLRVPRSRPRESGDHDRLIPDKEGPSPKNP